MPRRVKSVARKAESAVGKTTRKLTSKRSPRKSAAKSTGTPEPKEAKPKLNSPVARATPRTSDVPLDLLTDAYVPKQTGMKSSFRSDGADQQNDQEISLGAVDRFRDEDHFTNKSGDARIGTHGRTGIPTEVRTADGR